jgi:acetyl/propionyl-CoA carboxylase alpha subunit
VQVLGDASGNVLHFGERDCSVQRRHQKLIEESPSAAVDAGLRARLTDDAVRLCEAAAYRNAGTVEFLVGRQTQASERPYYFLEVNPRLQVEHPVTEAVAGVDFVELQLRVAAGERLGLAQDEVRLSGAAIELRVNAESPRRGFEPSPARVERLALPAGVRVDAGYAAGDIVPARFDSLFAKLIVPGNDRQDALSRARSALASLQVVGPATNAALLDRILAHEAFVSGAATIDWLDSTLAGLLDQAAPGPDVIAAAAVSLATFAAATPFDLPRWIGAGCTALWLWDGETIHATVVDVDADGHGTVTVNGLAIPTPPAGGARSPRAGDTRITVGANANQRVVEVLAMAGRFAFTLVPPPPLPRMGRSAAATGARLVVAPLAGTVAAIHIEVGGAVAPGDVLITLEAMKMEHRITADANATVAAVMAAEGAVVARGEPLIELVAPA